MNNEIRLARSSSFNALRNSDSSSLEDVVLFSTLLVLPRCSVRR